MMQVEFRLTLPLPFSLPTFPSHAPLRPVVPLSYPPLPAVHLSPTREDKRYTNNVVPSGRRDGRPFLLVFLLQSRPLGPPSFLPPQSLHPPTKQNKKTQDYLKHKTFVIIVLASRYNKKGQHNNRFRQ